jgi:hypothetical protein
LIGGISYNGVNNIILVEIDHYSKYVETKHLKIKEAEIFKDAIKELILGKHGVLKTILSDCDLISKINI